MKRTEEQRRKATEAQRRYRAKYPEKVKEHQANRDKTKHAAALKSHRVKKKEWLNGLKGNICQRCKLEWPSYVLEFHHRDPSEKEFILAKLYSRSKERILEEIKKCDVLCSNCHKIVEHENKQL